MGNIAGGFVLGFVGLSEDTAMLRRTISNWLYSYSRGVQWRQDYNVSDGYHLPRRIKSPPNQISSYKARNWRQEVTDVAAVHGTHNHLLQCLEMLLMPHLNSFRLYNGHIWLALGTFLSSLAQIVTDKVVVYSFSFFRHTENTSGFPAATLELTQIDLGMVVRNWHLSKGHFQSGIRHDLPSRGVPPHCHVLVLNILSLLV